MNLKTLAGVLLRAWVMRTMRRSDAFAFSEARDGINARAVYRKDLIVMTENMKAFLEQMNQNKALKDEVEALGKEQLKQNKDAIAEKVVEIAAKHGFTLTAEDMETETAELTEEQLKAVAGGGECYCSGSGGGRGFQNGGCECFLYGQGNEHCTCILAGSGD